MSHSEAIGGSSELWGVVGFLDIIDIVVLFDSDLEKIAGAPIDAVML